MALFMDSDFSFLKQNQHKDLMDFRVLFAEQDHCKGEFNMMIIVKIYSEVYLLHVYVLIQFD